MSDRERETAAACRLAAERLDAMSYVNVTSTGTHVVQPQVTTSAPIIAPGWAPVLAGMLRDAAPEFDEWADGTAILLCPHCWDLGNVARLMVGLEPADYDKDS